MNTNIHRINAARMEQEASALRLRAMEHIEAADRLREQANALFTAATKEAVRADIVDQQGYYNSLGHLLNGREHTASFTLSYPADRDYTPSRLTAEERAEEEEG